MILAQFTPTGYVEIDRTKLIEATGRSDRMGESDRLLRRTGRPPRPGTSYNRAVNWSHPAYANRHIIARNDQEIIRASLAAADYD